MITLCRWAEYVRGRLIFWRLDYETNALIYEVSFDKGILRLKIEDVEHLG